MPDEPYFRHSSRHLQTAATDRVENHLKALGWIGPQDSTPFGATPVKFVRRRIEETDLQSVTPNMVAVMFGDEDDDRELELGAGLLGITFPMWIDVVGDSDPIGLALAGDIKDNLTGRYPGTSRFLEVRDYTTSRVGVPVPGWRAEFVEVIRSRPQVEAWRKFWQVINVTVEVTFPGNG